MTQREFKIDMNPYGERPFAVFTRERRKSRMLGWEYNGAWKWVCSFETQNKAREHIEKLKGLPEYIK